MKEKKNWEKMLTKFVIQSPMAISEVTQTPLEASVLLRNKKNGKSAF